MRISLSLINGRVPKITISMAAQKSSTFRRYAELEPPKNIWQLSYVWIDGSVNRIRFKTRTMDYEPKTPDGMYGIQHPKYLYLKLTSNRIMFVKTGKCDLSVQLKWLDLLLVIMEHMLFLYIR